MKLQKLFVCLLCSILIAAVARAQDFAGKVFSGAINKRYPVRMTLTRQGATITGTYVYTKVGKTITLRGEAQTDGTVLLFEVNDRGENTGVFRGVFADERRFSGTWSEPDGSRTMPFEVEAGAATSASVPLEGGVIVEEKKVILRRGTQGKDGYKEAAVSFPVVKGAGPLTSKIQAAVSLKVMFDQSLEELQSEFREFFWLDEISYEVNYNKNFILDLTFSMSGTGAYPDTLFRHVALSIKTGEPLRAADVFNASSMRTIVAMVEHRFQSEIKEAISRWAKEGEDVKDLFAEKRYTEKDLDNLSVSDRGVTFLYDFGFPHVAKAVEPEGRYLFTFDQLRSHIRPDGPLGVFLK
jgi:hypothetical protein